ncbi:Glycosyl transferase, family 2 precursor [Acidisarcina polymorpha]|uniref:Glycosyl transferase, family 2 n=1 Tax=Acidisarcina polymorpha TaxID=2211140 RepID=A0A2Z5FTI6_9BACT|nr:glycosyltransferase family 2 protein [Acidisarcina polymorpha]AXC10138.1 Glycosyl transferase, family 2 precursor [Acidisarcina polymorpha]
MIRYLFLLVGSCCALITLPGTIELFVLTIAGMLPRRRTILVPGSNYRLAVIVPAHNEELHIARCIESLTRADRSGIDASFTVIADNCDDSTAATASRSGARVIVRENPLDRGKGYALDYAFRTMASEGWNAFAVVDADSEVAPNFMTVLVSALRTGASAVQCRYVVRNAHESSRVRLMKVANAAFNVLRPRGRERCGLSAGIYGNGFALSADTLSAVPYLASSLVEDLEYHLALVDAGKRVRFLDTTSVYGDMPAAGAGVKTQRTRWEGGRFRMIREKTPRLIRRIFRGRFDVLEPCLDLLLFPLAFHVALLLIAAATPFWPMRALALAGLATVVMHLAAAIAVTGGGWQDVAALLGAPFYIVWKILLIPRLARSANAKSAWTRTERTAERKIL